MLGNANVNSAAVSRLLDAATSGTAGTPVLQSAPPSHAAATNRAVTAAAAGPWGWGNGTLSAHARWDPRMACAAVAGEAARASAVIGAVAVGSDLLRVRGQASAVSVSELTSGARSGASATLDMRAFDLFGGAVHVRVVQAPALTAVMSAKGGSVHYRAPVVEISGRGIKTTRLTRPGTTVDIKPASYSPAAADQRRGSNARDDAAAGVDSNGAGAPSDADSPAGLDPGTVRSGAARRESGVLRLLGSVGKPAALNHGSPLPIPTVPGLPPVSDPAPESGHAGGSGTHLRVSLGDVRQATEGRAIAARATAMRVTVTQGAEPSRGGRTYGGERPSGVVLDLNIGVLEAAAVAPAAAGGVSGAGGGVSGAGGGLPITGPATGGLVLAGGILIVLGAGAVVLTRRRRDPQP